MRNNDGAELENIGFDVYDNWTEGARLPHRTSVIEITFQGEPIVQVRVTDADGERTVATRLVEPKDDDQ